MKIRNTLALIMFTLTLQQNVRGQNLFFIGNKSYPSTTTFRLNISSQFSSSSLGCLIAKNGTTGFFVVSKETMTGSVIKGNVTIYLDDGSVITLIDRGKRDYVDATSTNVYTLTLSEIAKLESSLINTVRFTIKCPGNGCSSSEDGDFTAKNEPSNISYLLNNSKPERENTMELVTELFK